MTFLFISKTNLLQKQLFLLLSNKKIIFLGGTEFLNQSTKKEKQIAFDKTVFQNFMKSMLLHKPLLYFKYLNTDGRIFFTMKTKAI